MSKADAEKPADQGISKVKLAIGAASLFLFIIGVKRTFQMDQHQGTAPEPPAAKRGDAGERRGKRRSDRRPEKKK